MGRRATNKHRGFEWPEVFKGVEESDWESPAKGHGEGSFSPPGENPGQAAFDPGIKNTTLSDLTGGSAVFYDTQVKVTRV